MAEKLLKRLSSDYFPFGFPLSRKGWDAFHVADLLLSPDEARSTEATTHAIRLLTDRVNAPWLSGERRGRPARAGLLIGTRLLSDIFRHVISQYVYVQNPGSLAGAFESARKQLGGNTAEKNLRAFVKSFPPVAVQSGKDSVDTYLRGDSATCPNREQAASEMVTHSVIVDNPALESIRFLFDDTTSHLDTSYPALVKAYENYFEGQAPVAWCGLTLFACLRAPISASPNSLEGQLQYIFDHWASVLPAALLTQVSKSLGVMKEETQPRGPGPGPIKAPEFRKRDRFAAEEPEPERFARDTDWMGRLVLMAKSVHVWLDQLSKRHDRSITRLDEIPEEELARLARWGFTGLWLIGVWERSPASRLIKKLKGNQEAHASAYSIYDYTIAEDLGGQPALERLKERAWRHGIRLGCDMVPNHTGIYSRWVIDHPDWFLQVDHPPFPAYRFTGPDLSPNPRISLYIEDGYWNNGDAAVVFKRVDNGTGHTTYIYHGNDGTHVPWNDTAQLNYLLPEVREAVTRTILHVARMFPIIRFDAAMTLTKKHYQRLWFPTHEEAGPIPSRAERGMSRAEFDEHMPGEFWRDVVDRVTQQEAQVVLIAEAFWLMEGYFVRSLGMHRVYNSAFMNMLRAEENAKYRAMVKNVLEFSPEILKRFLNFMSNPDEATAVEQFGKGDKYFGVATLMATMPGLPMFSHGQVEGHTEKYGMEYRSAYWNEPVDKALVQRHEAEIFPLLKKRHLFSGVDHFALYDFVTPDGHVDENVFAFSNRWHDETALVLYNNALATTRGLVRVSAPANKKNGYPHPFRVHTLAESLMIRTEPGYCCVFRDHTTNLEYIREGHQIGEQGFSMELRGYQYCVLHGFRAVRDTDGTWAYLVEKLGGQGVTDIETAHLEVVAAPLLEKFRHIVNAEFLKAVATSWAKGKAQKRLKKQVKAPLNAFLDKVEQLTRKSCDRTVILGDIVHDLDVICGMMPQREQPKDEKAAWAYLRSLLPVQAQDLPMFVRIPAVWVVLRQLGLAFTDSARPQDQAALIDKWFLGKAVQEAFTSLGREEWLAQLDVELIKILVRNQAAWLESVSRGTSHIPALFSDPLVRDYLYMNTYDGILWLNREQLETMMYWLFFTSVATVMADPAMAADARAEQVQAHFVHVDRVLDAADKASYQVDEILALLSP